MGLAIAADQDTAKVSIPVGVPRRSDPLTGRSGAIHMDVNLVLIPVTVTDSYERLVLGLQRADFRLYEEGVEQKVTQFFSEEAPISVGIVFDASASMRRKMEESQKAVTEFLRMCLPGDEFFLLKFSDQPESVNGFTTDIEEIERSLPTIQPKGWTSLYDAIYLSMNRIKRATYSRKVLLVVSDGGDNNSRYTEREIKDLVKEADVRIFAISIFDRSPSLEAIAEESGGRSYRVRKLEDLPGLAADIGAELHSQYVLGFSLADRVNDGKYRKIRVEVTQPAGPARLRASWKRGYYSPWQ